MRTESQRGGPNSRPPDDEPRTILLQLPEPPTANHYWQLVASRGRARIYKTTEAKQYQALVASLARAQGARPHKAEVQVSLEWVRTARRGDLDNRLKVVLDALRKVCYADDRQIRLILARRREAQPGEGAHVLVTITPCRDGVAG